MRYKIYKRHVVYNILHRGVRCGRGQKGFVIAIHSCVYNIVINSAAAAEWTYVVSARMRNEK